MEPAVSPTDPMTATALRSLRDIALPPPVSWMPQTWGWIVLTAVVAVVLMIVFLRWLRAYRADAYRREALQLLGRIEGMMRDPNTRLNGMHELGALLKRTTLACWGRPGVAALAGATWVRFLSEHDNEPADAALERLLDDLEYHRDAELSADAASEAISAARRWIGRHHVST